MVMPQLHIFKLNKYGRVFTKSLLGLFSIRRKIRHSLARDTYVDNDVKNCHPHLMSQICKHNNIQQKYLKLYIIYQAELLNEVMTAYNVVKEDVKIYLFNYCISTHLTVGVIITMLKVNDQ